MFQISSLLQFDASALKYSHVGGEAIFLQRRTGLYTCVIGLALTVLPERLKPVSYH